MRTVITPIAAIVWTFVSSTSQADLILTTAGSTEVIDFSGFGGAGFSPTPAAGQLDSNTWAVTGLSDGVLNFGGTATSGDFARGGADEGVTTGGIYAFDVGGGNIALGVQPGGSDFTPGDFTLRVQNGTGQTLTSFGIAYDVFTYNDQGRANSFNFSWSTDNSSYTPVSSFDYTSPEAADAAPAWTSVNRGGTIDFADGLADGSQFYLRWTSDDVSGSGSRDQFGLTNIAVSGIAAVPEPSSLLLMWYAGAGSIFVRRRRAAGRLQR